ncbi:hypothetical protein HZC09_05405 [Candidatus Micrarchaeota archaeon]|nr:hypothetical protein [Candidatus Micrarchaeota archaeon]
MNANKLKDKVKGKGPEKAPTGKNPQINMYVPYEQKGYMLEDGKKVPVHHLHVESRAELMSDLLSSDHRYGSLGTAYKSYFYAVVCFILTVLTYNINLYVAAAFAYLTGLYWSQRLCAPPWNITWYKGKALYHTT